MEVINSHDLDALVATFANTYPAQSDAFARFWDDPCERADGLDRLHVLDGRGVRTSFDMDVLTLASGDLRVVVFAKP